jgi:hypothetical protein
MLMALFRRSSYPRAETSSSLCSPGIHEVDPRGGDQVQAHPARKCQLLDLAHQLSPTTTIVTRPPGPADAGRFS